MTSWIIWFNLLLGLLVVCYSTFLFSHFFRQVKRIDKCIDGIQEQQTHFAKQHQEIHTLIRGQTHQFDRLCQQYQALEQEQQRLKALEPENRLYSRAVKMIALGADVQEVMSECELPKAEADLLFSLHSRDEKNLKQIHSDK